MADGEVRDVETCEVDVLWGAEWRRVLVFIVGTEPLLGMGMLAKHKIILDVIPGGTIEILPIT